ncbi:hypothetical protein DL96DRAFT_1709838 [Flagelloscypha sp. PMI_526]|nr:hypothetical protein DL96DRAFT_1709838 [Flagelloscypha sp. PMI_526]
MSLVGRLARTAASRTPCSHSSYATRPFWTRRLPSNSTPTRLRQTPNARRYYSVEKEVSQPEQGDAPTPLRNLPSSQPVKVAGLEVPSVDDPNFAVQPSEGEYDEDYENDEEYDDQEEIDQEEEDDDRQDPSGRDFSHITESVALGLRKKEFPPSPAFYSGRMNYTDQVEALHRCSFALSKVEPGPAIWHQKAAMVEAAWKHTLLDCLPQATRSS